MKNIILVLLIIINIEEEYLWLYQIGELDIIHTLELRDDNDGSVIATLGIDRRVFSHPFYDLSILHINKEKESLYSLKQLGYEISPLDICIDQCSPGTELNAIGYSLGKDLKDIHNRELIVFININRN